MCALYRQSSLFWRLFFCERHPAHGNHHASNDYGN
jgi:hypothetical protein